MKPQRSHRGARCRSTEVDLEDGLWSVAMGVAAPCSIAESLVVALDEVL